MFVSVLFTFLFNPKEVHDNILQKLLNKKMNTYGR